MNSSPQIIPSNPQIGDRGHLHLYLPEGKGPHPFILGIHGGGWNSGDQTSYAWLWPKVQPLGIGLVLCSYRLASAAPFPAAYEDLLDVLAWLKDHAASHRLDPARCLLFGGSAGGHLAMLLATRGTAGDAPQPHLRGVVNFCGIMDPAAQHDWDRKRSRTMTQDFFHASPAEDPGLFRAASPIAQIHPAMPPVWIAHGAADHTVSVDQSRNMAAKLREQGHSPVYLEACGLGHTMLETTNSGETIHPSQILFEQDCFRFMGRCLGL